LTYSVKNRSPAAVHAGLAFSILNPVGYDGVTQLASRHADFFGANRNQFRSEGELCGLYLSSSKYPSDSPRYGSMALVTSQGDHSYRLAWENGEWWDEFQKWWDEFLARGRFPNNEARQSEDKTSNYASLASHFALTPGERKHITFVLAWYFPNTE